MLCILEIQRDRMNLLKELFDLKVTDSQGLLADAVRRIPQHAKSTLLPINRLKAPDNRPTITDPSDDQALK